MGKKKTGGKSTMSRSREFLEADGWHVATVEQRIPHTFITRDAYGWADLLAVHPTAGIALIQVTSGGNLASRVAKARTVAGPLTAWLLAGGKLVAHGWREIGPRGAPKVWQVREVRLTLADLAEKDGGERVSG
jgi:hypothetical protein